MTPDQILRDKLRKIEPLFAGEATRGDAYLASPRLREAGQRIVLETMFAKSTQTSKQHG